jgi:hypothetical protein
MFYSQASPHSIFIHWNKSSTTSIFKLQIYCCNATHIYNTILSYKSFFYTFHGNVINNIYSTHSFFILFNLEKFYFPDILILFHLICPLFHKHLIPLHSSNFIHPTLTFIIFLKNMQNNSFVFSSLCFLSYFLLICFFSYFKDK